jgi:hypothetical protein
LLNYNQLSALIAIQILKHSLLSGLANKTCFLLGILLIGRHDTKQKDTQHNDRLRNDTLKMTVNVTLTKALHYP